MTLHIKNCWLLFIGVINFNSFVHGNDYLDLPQGLWKVYLAASVNADVHTDGLELTFNSNEQYVVIGNKFNLTLKQTVPKDVAHQSHRYQFVYSVEDKVIQEPLKNGRYFFDPPPPVILSGNETIVVTIDTNTGNNTAGELRIGINSTNLDLHEAAITVKIIHHHSIYILSQVVGWIYFVAWSISFYPQCWTNFKRKSVIGLNFDYLSLNLVGFSWYSTYVLGLYFNHNLQDLYHKVHPLGVIQVDSNDVFFVIHAIVLTLITISQCFIYDRGMQTVSKPCRILLGLILLSTIVTCILSAAKVMNWLDFVSGLSYIKLGITIIKYMPQAYMNYRRKSTDGWSIYNILLDFTGGSLSILQMFLKSYNYDDWLSIFGNITKFGLGLFSVLFDILFILQHYVFYRQAAPYDEIINGNRVGVM